MLSRVADSLYWMSRYLERAEHTARLLSVQFNLMLDATSPTAGQRWSRLLGSLRNPVRHRNGADPYEFIRMMCFDADNGASIVACIAAARENARQVREQISSEMWEHINRLYLYARAADTAATWDDQPQYFFQQVKEGAHLFQGITDSTLTHTEGWRYIQLGRYLERTIAIAALLDTHFSMFPQVPGRAVSLEEYFEWLGLLKSCTAFEAYCKVYSAELRPDNIAEFLICNRSFPHSVHFSVERIQHALDAIAEHTGTQKSGRVHRFAGRLLSTVAYTSVGELMENLHNYLQELQGQCMEIHEALYEYYIAYAIETAL
ncbi:MAG: alpha-E domain-containing protein [Anaerolineae bacterium]